MCSAALTSTPAPRRSAPAREARGDLEADLLQATRLQALAMRLVPGAGCDILLRDILATGADMLGAPKGCVLSFEDDDAACLRLAVAQGLSGRFIAHFEQRGWAALCDAAAACSPAGSATLSPAEDHAALRAESIAEIHSAPLLSGDGRLLGLLSHCLEAPRPLQERELLTLKTLARLAADCLERCAVERALREADRHKDEFLATLAHELRNPLGPIRNAIELLHRSRSAEVGGTAALLERQVQQIVRLVDDLYDVGRVARGQVELQRRRQMLQPIVAQAIENAGAMLHASAQQLLLRQPEAPLWVDVDAQRIAQALTNLLHNACKYAEPGAAPIELGIKGDEDAGEALIRLRDHGIGIAADQLGRIFDMFVQVDSPQRRARAGLGIGLTLVRRLVQLHGGSIEVRSDGPGCGSEFVVRLPLAGR